MLVFPSSTTSLSFAHAVVATMAVTLFALLLAVLSLMLQKERASRLLAPVPGPKGRFLIGLLPEVIRNLHRIHDFQVDLMKKYGGRTKVTWSLFGNNLLLLADPADVEHVLEKNVNNWVKSEHFRQSFGKEFGRSLLGINHAHAEDGGALFRIQRKVLTRVFTTNNFKSFTEGIFLKYILELVDVIRQQGGQCDMHTVASRFTLQTTFDIVCGVSLQSFDDLGVQFIASMDYVFGTVTARVFTRPHFRYLWWCMPSEYRYKREVKVVLDLVDGILEKRLAESEEELAKRYDVLSLLIRKARELGGEDATILDVPTLRSIIALMLFASRDTTASCIVYAFYTLAARPAEQDKILEELRGVDPEAPLTYSDAGLRMCPGMGMALLEAKLFVAILLRAFHVDMQNEKSVQWRPNASFPTLSYLGGLPLQLSPRRRPAPPATASQR
ncbi:hypothetical protein PybrP1_005199 [[Pythium] brassicae (nom. inval.)]|nr:hypothetical protein PybrP1_005199 [[Pythium] brassicae (nom. inval.)]